MLEESVFPEWLTPHLVQDAVFGTAYECVAAEQRAWLKTAIAVLHTIQGDNAVTWGRQERHWRQQYVSVAESRPVDWCLLLLDESSLSPVRLLASLMPAVLAGVRDILVVRAGHGDWPAPVLAALELAGQELAADVEAQQLERLLHSLCDRSVGCGRIVAMGNTGAILPSCVQEASHIRVWQEPRACNLAVARDADMDIDLLHWAHPDLALVEVDTEFQDVLPTVEQCAAFAGPSHLLDVVPDSYPLMLGSGQEGCWIWPDLAPDWFMLRRISLLTDL